MVEWELLLGLIVRNVFEVVGGFVQQGLTASRAPFLGDPVRKRNTFITQGPSEILS